MEETASTENSENLSYGETLDTKLGDGINQEDNSVDESQYKSRFSSDERYEKNQKSDKRNNFAPREGGLEERVERLKKEARKHGRDPEEYALHKLEEGEIAEYLAKKGTIKPKESTKVERSPHGVVAFICYTDPHTRKTYYQLEQNKKGYFPSKEEGKLRLIGGARDYIDGIDGIIETSFEALERELKEEFKQVASDILVEALYENGEKYTTVEDRVNGKVAYTDIYLIELESKKDWEAVAKSGPKDAGIFRVFDDVTVLNTPIQYFGISSGNLIKGFVIENMISKPNYIDRTIH